MSEGLSLQLALSFFGRARDRNDEARRAIVELLGLRSPPRELLDRIRDALVRRNVDTATEEGSDKRAKNIVWDDDQLTPDERDLTKAFAFLGRGFTHRQGLKNKGESLTIGEEAECRSAMARLLARDCPPDALLKALAAAFAPTEKFSNTPGWLVLRKRRLELWHRKAGRTSNLLRCIEIAALVREQSKRSPSETKAIEAVAQALAKERIISAKTVKSQLQRGKKYLASDG